MSRLDFRLIGGVAPSIDPHDLPEGAAQTASGLDLRWGDFRPLRGSGASVATVTSGTKSLHRTPSGTWLSSTDVVDYVNAQINDTTVERVYLTGRSAFPEAWESGSYRRLGVRAPASAPSVALDEVDEFTQQDRQQSINDLIAQIKAAVLANTTAAELGNGKPSDPGSGAIFLDHGTTTTPALPTTLATQIAYLTPTTSGVVDLSTEAYLQQPVLAGKLVTYSSQEYWAVGALWQAVGYDVDEAALATDLKALLKPPDNTDQLIPDATADQIAARIAGIADPTADPLAILIDRINSAQDDVLTFQTRELDDLNRAYALKAQLEKLEAAIRAVDEYFVQWETRLLQILADYEYLIPAYVERVIETRSYIYTYVTDWGEESAPSSPSTLRKLDQNDAVDITVVAPPSSTDYGATTHWRLYRSATSNSGDAFQFVAETAIGTLTYNDSKKLEELGEPCPTSTWTEPRADMHSLCGGHNGMMVGAAGNVLCFCEPDTPYAWPREYEIPLEHQIVSIRGAGTSWIVATDGLTYFVSGADSASASAVKLPRPQACVSKRSMVGFDGGAAWASAEGIVVATAEGCNVVTAAAYDQAAWGALTPGTSFGALHNGVYRLWLTAAGKRLDFHMDRAAIGVTTESSVTGAYVDMLTATLYGVVGTGVLPQFTGSIGTGTWKSGIVHREHQPSFAWMQVRGTISSTTVKLYRDGVLLSTKTFTSMEPQRVRARRGRSWEVQIESADRVSAVVLASSTAELQQG